MTREEAIALIQRTMDRTLRDTHYCLLRIEIDVGAAARKAPEAAATLNHVVDVCRVLRDQLEKMELKVNTKLAELQNEL